MRGADIYAKGILAASSGISEGMEVIVMVDLDKQVWILGVCPRGYGLVPLDGYGTLIITMIASRP